MSRNKKQKTESNRKWAVDYDLAYDGGGSAWTGNYRTKTGAKIALFYNRFIASWGGSAKLYHRTTK
jgi:hypothetical protein